MHITKEQLKIVFDFLKSLSQQSKDRYIKGHAKDLLTLLQALNPQDHD